MIPQGVRKCLRVVGTVLEYHAAPATVWSYTFGEHNKLREGDILFVLGKRRGCSLVSVMRLDDARIFHLAYNVIVEKTTLLSDGRAGKNEISDG